LKFLENRTIQPDCKYGFRILVLETLNGLISSHITTQNILKEFNVLEPLVDSIGWRKHSKEPEKEFIAQLTVVKTIGHIMYSSFQLTI
jgi:hypothetical protein